MGITIIVTQKCDICGKEEVIASEADARKVIVEDETLVLCEKHYIESDKLKKLIANNGSMKNIIIKVWKRRDMIEAAEMFLSWE